MLPSSAGLHDPLMTPGMCPRDAFEWLTTYKGEGRGSLLLPGEGKSRNRRI